MDTTPNLALPYIIAAQAQKHVTHNEAIRALDAVVNLSVLTRSLASPPLSPAEGARYIVAPSPTGAWTGMSVRIAAFQDGAWAFYTPREGWLAWVADEDALVVHNGTAWVDAGSGNGSVNPTPLVGVNATADATNRLAVSSPAILLNHAGAGHQAKINKNLAADTASFLFQTGFSGRAEMGTTGDDDFHFKVSPDGATWKDALQINRSTGAVTMPFTAGGGGGETNTASNVNVGGVGTFKQKTGVTLEFRGLNTGSSKVSVTLDVANNEIDIDVAEANLTLANLGGSIDLGGAKASGTLAAARAPAFTGDVTSVAGALATTIANDAVTNAKLANVATATIKGRVTAAAGDPEDLTPAQAKSVLAIAAADVSGLAASATTDTTNASNIATGTLGSARLPAFGSGEVSFAAAGGAGTVAANAITNAKLADVPTATFKGRTTAATGDPEDLTVAQAKSLLNLTGTNSGDQTITLTGDVTGSGTAGFAATIANDAVTNAKLANVATATIKGRVTAAAGDPEDLTPAQAKSVLAIAAADVSGLAASATTDTTNASNIASGTLGAARLPAFGSGDVSFAAAGGAGTVANNAVTYAKMQDVSVASRLLGRGDGGAGDPQEIILGAGLAMTGTTLSSSGGGGAITTQDEGVTLSAGVTTLNFVGAGVTASGAGATTTITIPGGGGGGSPGGADTQVQFNNAGAFAGAAGLTYNSATQISKHAVAADLESQASPPSAPATGSRLFSRPFAARQLPSFRNGGNGETPVQPFLGRNKLRFWGAQGNSATIALINMANTVTGTTTNRTAATTNLFTAMSRVGFVSAATAGSSTGTRHGFTQFFMGNGTAGIGGFHYVTRFGVSDAATVANARMFVGLSATAGVLANADPSTFLNQIGLGCDAGQTTLRIIHNDGAGVSTLVDLGANFPAQTLSTDMYELQLYCAPNGSTVGYRVERLNTGHVAEGTISTDLPINTTLLSPQLWRNNGATALAVGIDVVHQYMETDY